MGLPTTRCMQAPESVLDHVSMFLLMPIRLMSIGTRGPHSRTGPESSLHRTRECDTT
jgi:hypothetical protein